MLGVQLLISLVVGLTVLTLIFGVRAMLVPAEADDRLQQLLDSEMAPTLQQIEMHASFYERAIKPISTALLQSLGRLAPQGNIDNLYRKLETAGFPANMSVADFLGVKIISGLGQGFVFAALIYLARGSSLLTTIGIGLLFGGVGYLFPNVWLSRRVSARQTEILKALPDALDMMTICAGAGLGLSGAMQRVCENWDNALVDEFNRVITETRLGRSRVEALESMAKRTGVKEVLSFVAALTMAEKLGASTIKVLHVQAEQMRIARRQRAEQLAREASIKMLFPLVFLIFPAMFAVILGPAVPQLLETFGAL